MYRIALVNMPFAKLEHNAIGLERLKAMVRERFDGRVSVSILYANMMYARHIGVGTYQQLMGDSISAVLAGRLGACLFRRAAFPDEPDSIEALCDQPWVQVLMNELGLNRARYLKLRTDTERFLGKLREAFRLDEYDLAGFTILSTELLPSLALARTLKDRKPKLTTVLGGPGCEDSIGAACARVFDKADFVFSGPAMESFAVFLERTLNGEEESKHHIDGVFSAANAGGSSRSEGGSYPPGPCQGAIARQGPRTPMDEWPVIEHSGFLDELERYFPNGEIEPAILVQTSCGCPFVRRSQCRFCALNGRNKDYVSMGPERAMVHLEKALECAPRCRRYQAADNLLPYEYFDTVLPALKLAERPGKPVLTYHTRAELSQRRIEKLCECRVNPFPGIEALSTEALDALGKGTDCFTNILFLVHCRRCGLWPMWFLLMRIPAVEKEVYLETAELCSLVHHLPPPHWVLDVAFCRFSPYFENAEEYGLSLKPYDIDRYVFPCSRGDVCELSALMADTSPVSDGTLDDAIAVLLAAVQTWKSHWAGEDRPLLNVECNGQGGRLIDSRSGTPECRELDEVHMEVLRACREAVRVESLLDSSGETGRARLRRRLSDLEEWGVILEEDGRALSLALWEENAPQDATTSRS